MASLSILRNYRSDDERAEALGSPPSDDVGGVASFLKSRGSEVSSAPDFVLDGVSKAPSALGDTGVADIMQYVMDDSFDKDTGEVTYLNVFGRHVDRETLEQSEAGRKLIDVAKRDKQGRANFWEGVTRGGFMQLLPWANDVHAVGLTVKQTYDTYQTFRKLEKGEDVPIEELIAARYFLAESDRESNQTGWGMVGSILAQAPAFGVEFGMSFGIGAAVKKLLAEGSEEAAQKGAKALVYRGARKLALNMAGELKDKGARKAVIDLAKSGVDDLAGKLAAETMEEIAGEGAEAVAKRSAIMGMRGIVDDALEIAVSPVADKATRLAMRKQIAARVARDAGAELAMLDKGAARRAMHWAGQLYTRNLVNVLDPEFALDGTFRQGLSHAASVLARGSVAAGGMLALDEAAHQIIAPLSGAGRPVTGSELMLTASGVLQGNKKLVDNARWLSLGMRWAEYFSEMSGPAFTAVGRGAYNSLAKSAVGRVVERSALGRAGRMARSFASLSTEDIAAVNRLHRESTEALSGMAIRDVAEKNLRDIARRTVLAKAAREGKTLVGDALEAEVAKMVKMPELAKSLVLHGGLAARFIMKTGIGPKEFTEYLQKVGYDGVLEELGEESFNGFVQTLLGLDDAAPRGAIDRMRESFKALVPDEGTFWPQVFAFALPTVARSSLMQAQTHLYAGPMGKMTRAMRQFDNQRAVRGSAMIERKAGETQLPRVVSMEGSTEVRGGDSPLTRVEGMLAPKASRNVNADDDMSIAALVSNDPATTVDLIAESAKYVAKTQRGEISPIRRVAAVALDVVGSLATGQIPTFGPPVQALANRFDPSFGRFISDVGLNYSSALDAEMDRLRKDGARDVRAKAEKTVDETFRARVEDMYAGFLRNHGVVYASRRMLENAVKAQGREVDEDSVNKVADELENIAKGEIKLTDAEVTAAAVARFEKAGKTPNAAELENEKKTYRAAREAHAKDAMPKYHRGAGGFLYMYSLGGVGAHEDDSDARKAAYSILLADHRMPVTLRVSRGKSVHESAGSKIGEAKMSLVKQVAALKDTDKETNADWELAGSFGISYTDSKPEARIGLVRKIAKSIAFGHALTGNQQLILRDGSVVGTIDRVVDDNGQDGYFVTPYGAWLPGSSGDRHASFADAQGELNRDGAKFSFFDPTVYLASSATYYSDNSLDLLAHLFEHEYQGGISNVDVAAVLSSMFPNQYAAYVDSVKMRKGAQAVESARYSLFEEHAAHVLAQRASQGEKLSPEESAQLERSEAYKKLQEEDRRHDDIVEQMATSYREYSAVLDSALKGIVGDKVTVPGVNLPMWAYSPHASASASSLYLTHTGLLELASIVEDFVEQAIRTKLGSIALVPDWAAGLSKDDPVPVAPAVRNFFADMRALLAKRRPQASADNVALQRDFNVAEALFADNMAIRADPYGKIVSAIVLDNSGDTALGYSALALVAEDARSLETYPAFLAVIERMLGNAAPETSFRRLISLAGGAWSPSQAAAQKSAQNIKAAEKAFIAAAEQVKGPVSAGMPVWDYVSERAVSRRADAAAPPAAAKPAAVATTAPTDLVDAKAAASAEVEPDEPEVVEPDVGAMEEPPPVSSVDQRRIVQLQERVKVLDSQLALIKTKSFSDPALTDMLKEEMVKNGRKGAKARVRDRLQVERNNSATELAALQPSPPESVEEVGNSLASISVNAEQSMALLKAASVIARNPAGNKLLMPPDDQYAIEAELGLLGEGVPDTSTWDKDNALKHFHAMADATMRLLSVLSPGAVPTDAGNAKKIAYQIAKSAMLASRRGFTFDVSAGDVGAENKSEAIEGSPAVQAFVNLARLLSSTDRSAGTFDIVARVRSDAATLNAAGEAGAALLLRAVDRTVATKRGASPHHNSAAYDELVLWLLDKDPAAHPRLVALGAVLSALGFGSGRTLLPYLRSASKALIVESVPVYGDDGSSAGYAFRAKLPGSMIGDLEVGSPIATMISNGIARHGSGRFNAAYADDVHRARERHDAAMTGIKAVKYLDDPARIELLASAYDAIYGTRNNAVSAALRDKQTMNKLVYGYNPLVKSVDNRFKTTAEELLVGLGLGLATYDTGLSQLLELTGGLSDEARWDMATNRLAVAANSLLEGAEYTSNLQDRGGNVSRFLSQVARTGTRTKFVASGEKEATMGVLAGNSVAADGIAHYIAREENKELLEELTKSFAHLGVSSADVLASIRRDGVYPDGTPVISNVVSWDGAFGDKTRDKVARLISTVNSSVVDAIRGAAHVAVIPVYFGGHQALAINIPAGLATKLFELGSDEQDTPEGRVYDALVTRLLPTLMMDPKRIVMTMSTHLERGMGQAAVSILTKLGVDGAFENPEGLNGVALSSETGLMKDHLVWHRGMLIKAVEQNASFAVEGASLRELQKYVDGLGGEYASYVTDAAAAKVNPVLGMSAPAIILKDGTESSLSKILAPLVREKAAGVAKGRSVAITAAEVAKAVADAVGDVGAIKYKIRPDNADSGLVVPVFTATLDEIAPHLSITVMKLPSGENVAGFEMRIDDLSARAAASIDKKNTPSRNFIPSNIGITSQTLGSDVTQAIEEYEQAAKLMLGPLAPVISGNKDEQLEKLVDIASRYHEFIAQGLSTGIIPTNDRDVPLATAGTLASRATQPYVSANRLDAVDTVSGGMVVPDGSAKGMSFAAFEDANKQFFRIERTFGDSEKSFASRMVEHSYVFTATESKNEFDGQERRLTLTRANVRGPWIRYATFLRHDGRKSAAALEGADYGTDTRSLVMEFKRRMAHLQTLRSGPAGEYLKYVRNAIAPMVETHTGDSLFQDEDGMPIKAAELNLEELDGYSMRAVSFDDLFIERKTGGKTELVIDAAAFYYDAEHNDAVEIDGVRRAMVAGTLVYGERTPSGHPASSDLVRLSIPQNSYDLSHDSAPEPLVAATFVLADGRVVRDVILGGVVPSGENTIVKTPEQVHLAGSDADADKTTLLFFDYGDSGIIVTGGSAVAARDRALSDVHAGKDAETAMYDALAPFSNSVMMARAVAARNMSVARLAEHESAVTKNRTGRYSFVYTADTTPVSAKLFDRAYHDSRMLGRTGVALEHEGAFADLLADAGLKFMLPSEDAAPASYEQLVSAWDEKEGAGYSDTALIHKPVTPNPRSFADMAALSLAVNDAGEKGRGSTVSFTNLVNLLQSLELWGGLRESAIKAPTKEQYANLRYWAVLLSNMAFDVENEGTFNRAGFTGDSLRFYYAGLMSRNWGSRAELHAFHDMWMLWANSAAGRKAIDEPAHIDPDSDLAAALNRYDTMKKVTSILQRKNKALKGMHDVLETSESLVSAELAKEALGDRAKAALESVETKLNRTAEAYVNSIEASRAYKAFFDISLKLPKIKDVKKREGAKTVLSSRTKFVERLGHAVDTTAALKLLHLLGNERLENGDAYNLYDDLSRDGDGLSLIELALVAEQAYDSLRLAVLHERADVPDGGFKGAPRLFRALTRWVRAGKTSNIESWVGVNFVDESVDLGDIRKEVERFIDTYPNSVTVTLNRKIDLVDVSREFKLDARQVMLLLFVHNAITAKSASFTPSRERGFGALMPATWWNEFAQLRTQALGTAHDNKGIMDYALFPKDRWLDVDKHGQLIVKTYDDVASVENQISGSGRLYDAGDTLPNDTGRFKSVSGVVDGVDVFGVNPTNTIILNNDAALANRPAGYAAARVYGSSNQSFKKGVHIADPFYRVATVRRRGLPTAKWLDSAITGSPRKDEVSAALPAKAEIITGDPPAPRAPQPHPLLDSVRVVPRDPSTLLGAPNYAKAVDRNELVEGTGFPMRSGVAMPNGIPRKYIAYDYETSGLDTSDAGIITQIGAILMEDGKAVRHFNAFVHNPGYAAFLKANEGKDFAAAMAPYADIISRPEKDGEKRDDGDGTTLAWSLDKAAAEFCKFVEESGAEWFAGFNSTNFDLLLTRKMAAHVVGKLGANAPGVLGKLVDADRQYDVFALAKYHAGNGRRERTSKEKLSPPMPGVGRLGDMNDAYLKQLDARAGRLSVLFNKHFDPKYEIDAAMPEAGLNKLNEMLSQAGIPIDGNNVAHNALADVAMTAVLLEGDVSKALLSGNATTPRDVGFSIASQPEIELVTRAWEAKVVGAPRSATDVANNLKAYKTKSRKSFRVTEITGLLNVDHAFTSTDAADNGTAAHAVLADVIENMEKVPTRSDGSVDKSADDVRRALLDRFPPGEFIYCTEKDDGNQLEKFNVRGRADLIVVDRKTGVATVIDFKPYHSNKLGVYGEGEASAFEREQAQVAIYHDLMKGMGYEVSDSGYIAYYGNSSDASPLVEVKVDAITDNATHLRKYALGLMIDGTGADQDIGSDVSSKLTGSLFDVLGNIEDEYKREVADLLNNAAIISTGMTGSGELLAKFGHEFARVARIVNAKLFDITRYQTVQDYRGALAARDALVDYIRKQASPFGAKDKTKPQFAYRAFLTLLERAEKQPPVVAGVNKDTSAIFYKHNAIEYRNTKAAFLRLREELHKWNGPREVKTQVATEIAVIEAMHSALERANAALMRYQRDEGKLIEELRAVVGDSDDYADQAPLHPGVDRAAILAFGDLDHVELRRIVTRPAYFQAVILPTFRGIPMREIVQNHDIENVAKRFIESAAWYQILNAADDPKFIREIVEQDIGDAMFKNDETTGELKELTLEEKKAFVDKNGSIKRMKRIGGVQYVAGRLTKTQDQHDLIDFLVNKAVLVHLFGDSGVITTITIDASNWVDERRKAAIPTADDIMAIVPGASTERKKNNSDAPVSTLEVAVTQIHKVLPKPLRGVAVMALAEAATQARNQLDMLPGMAEASMGSRLHKFNQLFTGELENRGWGVSRQNSGGGDTFGCRLVVPNNKIQDAFNADTELQELLVKSGRKIGDFNIAAMAKRIAPEFRNLHDALLAAAPYSLTSADSQRLFDLRNPLPFVVGGGMFRVFNEEKLTRTLLTTEDEVDRLRKSFEETLAKGANLPLSQMTDMPAPMVSFFKDLLGLDEPHGVTWDDIKGGIKYVNYGLGPKATRADLAKAIYNISLERVAQLAVKSDDATQRHDQTSSVQLAGIVESMRQMSVKYGLDVNLSGMSMSSIYSKFGYLPANIGVSDLLATHAQGAARGLQEKYAVNNALLQQDEKGRPLVYAKPGLIDDGTVIGEPMWQVLAKWWADSNGFAYDATKTGRENAELIYKQVELLATNDKNVISVKYDKNTGAPSTLFRKLASGYESVPEFMAKLGDPGDADDGMLACMAGGSTVAWMEHLVQARQIRSLSAMGKAAEWLNTRVKTVAMSLSGFHIAATLESAMVSPQGIAGALLGATHAPLMRKFGATKLGKFAGVTENTFGQNDALRMINTNDPYYQDVRDMLNVFNIPLSSASDNPADIDRSALRRDIKNMAKFAKIHNIPFTDASGKALDKMLYAMQDNVTGYIFQHIVNAVKITVTLNLVDKLRAKALKQNRWFDPVVEMRRWAPYINAEVGGIDPTMYPWLNPNAKSKLRAWMLSWQWTFGAWEAGGGGPLTQWATGFALHPDVQSYIIPRWLRMAGGIMYGVPMLFQLGITALGKATGTGDDDDKWWNWQNEIGREDTFDITPLLRLLAKAPGVPWAKRNLPFGGLIPAWVGDDSTFGRRRYYMHFGKQGFEIARWFTNPLENAWSKMALPVQRMFTAVVGRAPNSDFAESFAGEPFGESFWDRMGYVGGMFQPMSYSSWKRNRDAGILSAIGPVSKGISATAAREAMKDLLSDYAEPKAYDALRSSPRYWNNHQALLADYLEALRLNGHDPQTEMKDAVRTVLTRQYREVYESLPNRPGMKVDERRLANAIASLHRMNFIEKNLWKSIESRDKRNAGKVDLTDDVMKTRYDYVRDAFLYPTGRYDEPTSLP